MNVSSSSCSENRTMIERSRCLRPTSLGYTSTMISQARSTAPVPVKSNAMTFRVSSFSSISSSSTSPHFFSFFCFFCFLCCAMLFSRPPWWFPTTMLSPTSTHTLSFVAAADEMNWIPWVGLPNPRYGAQALTARHFAFIVGGTDDPNNDPYENYRHLPDSFAASSSSSSPNAEFSSSDKRREEERILIGKGPFDAETEYVGDEEKDDAEENSTEEEKKEKMNITAKKQHHQRQSLKGKRSAALHAQSPKRGVKGASSMPAGIAGATPPPPRVAAESDKSKIPKAEGMVADDVDDVSSSSVLPLILFNDLLVLYQFSPLEFVGPFALPPLLAKAGAILHLDTIFIAYATNVLLSTVSGLFVKVSLPDLNALSANPSQPVQTARLPSSIPRFGAALGGYVSYIYPPPDAFETNVLKMLPESKLALYIFGGADRSGDPIGSVELYVNESWHVLPGLLFPRPYCRCSVTQGVRPPTWEPALYISNCVVCRTWVPANDTVIFLPNRNVFVYDFSNASLPPWGSPFHFPAIHGGSAANRMGMYMPGVTYVPTSSPDDGTGLTLNLYDLTLQELNQKETTELQMNRYDCALFCISAFMLCVGGRLPDGSPSALGDALQTLPNVLALPDVPTGIYPVKSTPRLVTQGSCLATTTLMLSTTPDCTSRVPMTSIYDCVSPETVLPIDHLELDVGQSIEMYVCATDGTCVVPSAERQLCGGSTGAVRDECRWQRCCWDARAQQCYAPVKVTTVDQFNNADVPWLGTTQLPSGRSYNPLPIVLQNLAPVMAPAEKYMPTWVIALIAVVSSVLMYFIIASLWKIRKQQREARKSNRYASNAFFAAFGKAYQVEGLIGQGSYGAVFLAERARDKQLVALKIIPCCTNRQRDAALREFDVLNRLRHPNLIAVLDLIINWDTNAAGVGLDAVTSGARRNNSNIRRIQNKKQQQRKRSHISGGGSHNGGGSSRKQNSSMTSSVPPVGQQGPSNRSLPSTPATDPDDPITTGASGGGEASSASTSPTTTTTTQAHQQHPPLPAREGEAQAPSSFNEGSPFYWAPHNRGDGPSMGGGAGMASSEDGGRTQSELSTVAPPQPSDGDDTSLMPSQEASPTDDLYSPRDEAGGGGGAAGILRSVRSNTNSNPAKPSPAKRHLSVTAPASVVGSGSTTTPSSGDGDRDEENEDEDDDSYEQEYTDVPSLQQQLLPSRFICIATEFFPEGDLTNFVLNYPRRGAVKVLKGDPIDMVMHVQEAKFHGSSAAGGGADPTAQRRGLPGGEDDEDAYGCGGNVSGNRSRSGSRGSAGGGKNATQPTVFYSSRLADADPNTGLSVNTTTTVVTSSGDSYRQFQDPPPNNAAAAANNTHAVRALPRLIPECIIVNFSIQIAAVLQFMHEHGDGSKPIVHRDLKPDNVLVDRDRVVVTDFGMAWQSGAPDGGISPDTCVGTLFFTAPECLGNSGSASPSSDMWALGCVIYGMCTRRVTPETARVMFADVDDDTFEEDMRADLAAYSSGLVDVVLRLLQRVPEERPTARQTVIALGKLLAPRSRNPAVHHLLAASGTPTSSPPGAPTPQFPNPVDAAIAAAVAPPPEIPPPVPATTAAKPTGTSPSAPGSPTGTTAPSAAVKKEKDREKEKDRHRTHHKNGEPRTHHHHHNNNPARPQNGDRPGPHAVPEAAAQTAATATAAAAVLAADGTETPTVVIPPPRRKKSQHPPTVAASVETTA